MHIHGLQKLAMVDYPGKLAATVFTGGCDLRCPFCHNALLVTRLAESPELPEGEVLDFLSSRRGLLDGVVLSGGEPMLQPDAAGFLRKIRDMGFAVKLDTNGHPSGPSGGHSGAGPGGLRGHGHQEPAGKIRRDRGRAGL